MPTPSFSIDVDFRNENVTARSAEGWTFAGLFDPGPAGAPYVLDLDSTQFWYGNDAEFARPDAARAMPREIRLAAIESMLIELAVVGRRFVIVVDGSGPAGPGDPDAWDITALIERLRPGLGAELELEFRGRPPRQKPTHDPFRPLWFFLVAIAMFVVIGVGWTNDSRLHHALLLHVAGREVRARYIDLDSKENPLSQSLAAAFYVMFRPRIFTLTFVYSDQAGREHWIRHEVGDINIDWMDQAGPEEDRLKIVYLPFAPEVAMPVNDIHFESLEAVFGVGSLLLAMLVSWAVIKRPRLRDGKWELP